jgi:hypothetical protein
MQAAFERDTFLNVEACLVFDERLDVDIVVVGAAEGTPHIAGSQVMRRVRPMRCAEPSR